MLKLVGSVYARFRGMISANISNLNIQYGLPDNIWSKVCFFSIESLVSSTKSLLRYIVKINIVRVVFICYSIYYVYGEQIVKYLRTVKNITFNIDDVMSIVSFIVAIYAGIGEYTIFWQDFMEYYHVNGVGDMSFMLNEQLMADKKELVYDWAYISRAMIKMQNLGILQLDFISTLGTVSQFNINRLHVTVFGQQLIKYI